MGVAGAAVDGFVVYSMPDDDPHLAAALARPVPSVICDQPSIAGADLVGIDDSAAIKGVADHLLALGHRRIGVICMRLGRARLDGPVTIDRQNSAHYHVQRNRLMGLREAFTAAGVAWDRIPVVERFEHSVAAGASAAAEVLALDPGHHRTRRDVGRARARCDRRADQAPAAGPRGRVGHRFRRGQGGHRREADDRRATGGGEGSAGRPDAAQPGAEDPGPADRAAHNVSQRQYHRAAAGVNAGAGQFGRGKPCAAGQRRLATVPAMKRAAVTTTPENLPAR